MHTVFVVECVQQFVLFELLCVQVCFIVDSPRVAKPSNGLPSNPLVSVHTPLSPKPSTF